MDITRASSAYIYRDHQIGRYGAWERIDQNRQPWPPYQDEGTSMQRFATSELPPKDGPRPREMHAADFVCDFDAHQPWLNLEHAWEEVRLFLAEVPRTFGLDVQQFEIAFSGKGGFHLSLPSIVLGDWVSVYTTQAYRLLAQSIRDELDLVTLDAPTQYKNDLPRWRRAIEQRIGFIPAEMSEDKPLRKLLGQSSFYARRRLIRRLNSPRDNGLFKIPLTHEEFLGGLPVIMELACAPRMLPPVLPRTNAILEQIVVLIIREFAENESRQREQYRAAGVSWHSDDSGQPLDDVRLPHNATAPLCVQRLLATAPGWGASNQSVMSLASYYRAKGIDPPLTVDLVRQWLLTGVHDSDKWNERTRDAESVTRAVYSNGYQFGFPFMRGLDLIHIDECESCPLRDQLPLCRIAWDQYTARQTRIS